MQTRKRTGKFLPLGNSKGLEYVVALAFWLVQWLLGSKGVEE
jgi:hypothetical protein